MHPDDITRALDAAKAAVREGGAIARSRLGQPGYLKWRNLRSVVSEASVQVQEAMTAAIRNAFPEAEILTEEGPDDAVLPLEAPELWIVDPASGSLNFAQGVPHFALSVALRAEGNIIVGVVYDPCRDELFEATHLGSAKLNGRKIVVEQLLEGIEAWSEAVIGTDWPAGGERRKQTRLVLGHLESQVRECLLMGSPALGLCYLAAGRLHAYWHLDLSIWDIAAASLIVNRAGGVLTDADGTSWLYSDGGYIATNTVIHGWILNSVQAVRNLAWTGEGNGRIKDNG